MRSEAKQIETILGEDYYSAEYSASLILRSKSNLLLHARLNHLKSIMIKGGKYFKLEWLKDFMVWLEDHNDYLYSSRNSKKKEDGLSVKYSMLVRPLRKGGHCHRRNWIKNETTGRMERTSGISMEKFVCGKYDIDGLAKAYEKKNKKCLTE